MPLGSKCSYFKRQEVKADGLLRPGPRNKHDIIFALFFWLSSHRACCDSNEKEVKSSAGKSVKKCATVFSLTQKEKAERRLIEGRHIKKSKGAEVVAYNMGTLSRSPWLDTLWLFFFLFCTLLPIYALVALGGRSLHEMHEM